MNLYTTHIHNTGTVNVDVKNTEWVGGTMHVPNPKSFVKNKNGDEYIINGPGKVNWENGLLAILI